MNKRSLFLVLRSISQWKYTLIVCLLLLPALVATVVLCVKAKPRTFPKVHDHSQNELVAARDEAMERSTHFELLMVGLGSFELGILAYLGGMLTRGKTYISRPRMFFYLSILLLAATTGAYLHVWRIYISYGIYAVKLERIGWDPVLQVTSQVFRQASNPNLDSSSLLLQLPANASTTISIVSFYPVFVLSAAILAFGKRFQINDDNIFAMLVAVLSGSIIYVLPDLIEFSGLVALNASP